MPTKTPKTAAKAPAQTGRIKAVLTRETPPAVPEVDATYPAQRTDTHVDPDTGYAHIHVQGVFDREAVKGLAKVISRLAIEVS